MIYVLIKNARIVISPFLGYCSVFYQLVKEKSVNFEKLKSTKS